MLFRSNVEGYVLAGQMVRKLLAPRGCFSLGVIHFDRLARCLHARHIGIEVFQPQSQLIAVEAFRSPSKLRPLQALDDEPEPLHLGTRHGKLPVVIDHLGGKLAHQPMQSIDIDRKRGEIEIHARDSNIDRQRPP